MKHTEEANKISFYLNTNKNQNCLTKLIKKKKRRDKINIRDKGENNSTQSKDFKKIIKGYKFGMNTSCHWYESHYTNKF